MIPKIAVILTDSNRKILWVNQDFTYITGYEFEDVIGKKPSLLQGEDSEEDAILRIRKGLESELSFKEQITNYRKNGEAYICKLVIHPVFDKLKRLTNFIAFEVDGSVVEEDNSIPLLEIGKKYQSSSLKGIDEIKLYFMLIKIMEEEKLYLNPNLKLKNVADKLGTNTKYLSQVVNNNYKENFQHFVNSYRIEESKIQIADNDNQNLTLYGIALQCGFKNKSTFYKVFKEFTGLTPRAFMKGEKV